MMGKTVRPDTGFHIGMVYIGTVVGAGFASGQEILHFFTRFGSGAYAAIAVSALLFIFVGVRVLQLGQRCQAVSLKGLTRQVFGPLSAPVDLYLFLAYLLLLGAMFAGAGALFRDHFRLSYPVGALLTAGASLAVAHRGAKGLLTVNSLLVPLILLFNTLVFFYTLLQNPSPAAEDLVFSMRTLYPLLRTGTTYGAFNLILSVGVLAPLGARSADPKSLWCGGLLGGLVLGAMLVMSHYALASYGPAIFFAEIPMLRLIEGLGHGMTWFYGGILWTGIFTTAIGNLFAAAALLKEYAPPVRSFAPYLILALGLMVSTLGFSNIVAGFYPILGVIGFVLIGILLAAGMKKEV